MNHLFYSKYINAEIDEADLLHWEIMEQNRYGFVYVKNPHYLVDGDDREYLIRKPTPKERREIVVNTVIECNGRTFKIYALAQMLGVSERTVQTILRQLEKDGLIQIIPKYGKNGKQKGNAYKYIGPPCEKYGSGLTLKVLYNAEQDAGFRSWAWKEYEFGYDKVWHDIYKLCKIKFDARINRGEYLKQNNLPLVVPEDIKYLVLRYAYWKGRSEIIHHGGYGKEMQYSKDGVIKLALEPLNRCETVPFFGYTLLVEFGGTKDNPQITISNAETKETLGAFTWFTENVIQSSEDLDEDISEQFFILGDFTAR